MLKELEKYNEVQRNYLVAKAELMVLEEEMVKFHKEFFHKEFTEIVLEAEEEKEKELGLYEAESKFFQAEKELKNWFMEEIKDDSRIPAKIKKELLSNKDISSPKIQNKIKDLALQWDIN